MREREPQFVHEREFLGALAELAFPVLAASCVLVSQRGRVVGKSSRLRVRFLGRIHVFVSVPEPLMGPVGDRSQASGQEVGKQRRFVEPSRKNPVQHNRF